MVIDIMLNTSQAVDFFKKAKESSSRNRRHHLQNSNTMPIPSYIEYAETSTSAETNQDVVGKQRGGSFCKQAIEVANNPLIVKISSSSSNNNGYEEERTNLSLQSSSLKGVDSAEDSSGRSYSASCRSYEMDIKTGSIDSISNNNNGMQDVSFRSGGQSFRSSELVKAQQGSFSSTTSLTASFQTYLEETENGEGDDDDDDDEICSSSALRDDEESANLSCVVEEVNEEGHQQSSSTVEESSAEEAIKMMQYHNDSVVQEAIQKVEANYDVHSQEDINIINVDDRDGDMEEERMNIVKDDDDETDDCDTYGEKNHNDDDDEQFEDRPVSQPQVPSTALPSMADICLAAAAAAASSSSCSEQQQQQSWPEAVTEGAVNIVEDRCYSPDGESLVSIDDDLSFAAEYDEDENDYEYLFSYELFMIPLYTIKEEDILLEDCCYEEEEEI